MEQPTAREQDVERAMREVARIGDPVVAGLIKGLIETQSELIRRIQALEAQGASLSSPLSSPRYPTTD